jgi:hypothetical protein
MLAKSTLPKCTIVKSTTTLPTPLLIPHCKLAKATLPLDCPNVFLWYPKFEIFRDRPLFEMLFFQCPKFYCDFKALPINLGLHTIAPKTYLSKKSGQFLFSYLFIFGGPLKLNRKPFKLEDLKFVLESIWRAM